jgi:hypothetical protein
MSKLRWLLKVISLAIRKPKNYNLLENAGNDQPNEEEAPQLDGNFL